MSSRWSSALLGLALVAGCGSDRPASDGAGSGAPPVIGATAEAARLGAEALDVLDDVTAYATSRRRLPRHLREAGIDSLTPETARWLERTGDGARVWVAFRRETGHTLVACGVDSGAREDASLATGSYRAVCRTPDGTRRTVEVTGE